MDTVPISPGFRFEEFCLDRHGSLLRADGSPVPMGSRALDVLRVLVEKHGQLVPKQDIMDVVWPGLAVEEGNLTVQVSALRKILDAGRAGASCIQNVPGRGYRFVCAVTHMVDLGDTALAAAAPGVAVGAASALASPSARRRVAQAAIVVVAAAMVVFALFVVIRHRVPADQFPRLSL